MFNVSAILLQRQTPAHSNRNATKRRHTKVVDASTLLTRGTSKIYAHDNSIRTPLLHQKTSSFQLFSRDGVQTNGARSKFPAKVNTCSGRYRRHIPKPHDPVASSRYQLAAVSSVATRKFEDTVHAEAMAMLPLAGVPSLLTERLHVICNQLSLSGRSLPSSVYDSTCKSK